MCVSAVFPFVRRQPRFINTMSPRQSGIFSGTSSSSSLEREQGTVFIRFRFFSADEITRIIKSNRRRATDQH